MDQCADVGREGQAAARDGGITTLKHADQETFAILLGVYARFRTIVYGD